MTENIKDFEHSKCMICQVKLEPFEGLCIKCEKTIRIYEKELEDSFLEYIDNSYRPFYELDN